MNGAMYQNITTSNSAEMLCKIIAGLDSLLAPLDEQSQSRRKSYRVPSHYEPFDQAKYEAAKQRSPFRREEWMCRRCMGKTFPLIGAVVDYQVPLKHSQDCAGMGKIDLLSRNGDTAWLLETKVPNSTEAPLRAIMEIFTYWKQLGGDDSGYFLERSAAQGAVKLKKAIVLFQNTEPSSIYAKLEKDAAQLRELMEKLDVSCFTASLEDGDPENIVGISQWR